MIFNLTVQQTCTLVELITGYTKYNRIQNAIEFTYKVWGHFELTVLPVSYTHLDVYKRQC